MKNQIKNPNFKFDLNIIITGNTDEKEFCEKFIEDKNQIFNFFQIDEESIILSLTHPIIKSWNFFFLTSLDKELQISKSMKMINQYFHKTNSIIIIVVDILNKQNTLEDIIKDLEKNVIVKIMPFIYILTKDHWEIISPINIRNFIKDNSKLDNTNFYFGLYPKGNNKTEKDLKIREEIVSNLIKFASYYNELGDLITIPYLNNKIYNLNKNSKIFGRQINILLCGKSGVGKSSFINAVLRDKRVKIGGNGISTTQYINEYNIPNTPIKLYDTPGFEDSNTVENIIELLKQNQNIFETFGKQIHLILFFFNQNDNTLISKMEYPFIKYLFGLNIKFIFIETHSKFKKDIMNKDFKDEVERLKNSIETSLNFYKIDYDLKNFIDDFFPVNLVYKDNLPIFGISSIFEYIYLYFYNQSNDTLELIKNIDLKINKKDLFDKIKKDTFLSLYSSYHDYLKKIENAKNSIILKYIFLCGVSGINPIPFLDLSTFSNLRNELLLELSKLYGFDEKYIDEFKYNKGIAEVIKSSFGILISHYSILPLFYLVGSILGGLSGACIIWNIGNSYSKFLLNKIKDKDDIFFIKSAAEDYLEAIQDFKYLSDFFKKIEEGKDICDDFNENIYFNKNNEENIKESKIDLNDFYIQ